MDTIIGLGILASRINEKQDLILMDLNVVHNAIDELKTLRSRITYLEYENSKLLDGRNDRK